jgi:hypothetical protein
MRFGLAMNSSSILLHRARFLAIGGFREDHGYAEDTEAWFRLCCHGRIYHVAEALSRIDVESPGGISRTASSLVRAAGLKMLIESYEAYRSSARIPAAQACSCQRFMQHQRGRVALHLINAGHRLAGIRFLLTTVPIGAHTWREYLACARSAVVSLTRQAQRP